MRTAGATTSGRNPARRWRTRVQRLRHDLRAYDPAGNRTLRIDSSTRTTSSYDAANQLLVANDAAAGRTTYQYDTCGNRTQQNAAGVLTYYDWDVLNRLTQVTPVAGPVTMTYDADGRRVRKQGTSQDTRFVYDFEKVLQECDGGTGDTTREYTQSAEQYGELLSEYDAGLPGSSGYTAPPTPWARRRPCWTMAAGSASDRYTYRAFGAVQALHGDEHQPVHVRGPAQGATTRGPGDRPVFRAQALLRLRGRPLGQRGPRRLQGRTQPLRRVRPQRLR